ncbi:NAD(P)/FAD-dependent oxidoreductase [Curtobacterium sp. MCBD17_032]|uniref:NAD(P)/FAD-dependent oxidoreductase n=1 Tax=Curtobacterium sp. MCBD17_032 TaxID=2175659 RepID=UPI000DA80D8C|nr:FAD/NAD(P)-binding oxidoreductase [Curtobacterium sp. MCBD17_032]PZE79732.1 NAD(P)/FAD-dependent oxidoreductase [Curtobacterium sp. MCBD17_032]
MPHHRHLIVGGGMVADSAARGIRELDPDGTIGIISEDVDRPYARPALSKKLWTDPDFSWDEKVDLHTEETGAEFVLGTRVESIDRAAKTVSTADGQVVGYDRLLLATGGHPRDLPGLEPSDRVLGYRSAADYRALRRHADAGASVVVVGGSYIGTEIAAGLVQNGVRVTLVTPDDVLGGHVFPAGLAAVFQQRFVDAGVEVRTGRRVESGEETADGVVLTLVDGSTVTADVAVVGLGIDPATRLAEDAGLTVDDGVRVSRTLGTDDPAVFAAGDVASYPDRLLGTRRVEHVDNAQQQGRQAGRNMAGADEPYEHTPMSYSSVFDVRYEAVGTVSSSLRTVEDWAEPHERGVVYHLDDDDLVTGVLLWNVPGKTDEARKVLAEAHTLTPDLLPGTISAD